MQRLISDVELARLTGRSRSSWQKDRFKRNKNSIPFIRVGRKIAYRPEDIEAWLQKNSSASPAAPNDKKGGPS